ncbi:MAG: phosphoribosylamine--glycine ligase, partial [bacterium]
HALAWKIRKSPHVSWLGCAPGNEGTRSVAEPVEIAADNIEGIVRYVHDNQVSLTVVGPEAPLAAGIASTFDQKQNILFGPSKEAAKLESNKVFAKDLMASSGIPTAHYATFTEAEGAKAWIDAFDMPMVVKASGLAAGKGVIICDSVAETKAAVDRMLVDREFGDAGSEIIVEERLDGQEISLLAICDGDTYMLLPPSQDHKRIGDGDTGPNTGGMGAYAPTPLIEKPMIERCGRDIFEATLEAMKENGTPYRGVLYVGLMITSDGPKVLEYNVRFGDPESQAVLPMLSVDLVDLMLAGSMGKLTGMLEHLGLKPTEWKRISRAGSAATVVLASAGYPGKYETGKRIIGLPGDREDLVVFHAGTKRVKGELVTSGGRVLSVTGMAETLKGALDKTYAACDKIQFEGRIFRRDIGWKAMN